MPSPRRSQTSTLVGTRLYFFGGQTSTITSNEVWYLELSNSFNISTPPWHNDVAMPVGYSFGTSCLSPINNSTVFLIGGRILIANTRNYSYTSSVYKFDSNTSQWTTPTINTFNPSFVARNEMQAVIDNNGKIFVFGGINHGNNDNITTTAYFDMNVLDITTMTWSITTQPQSDITYADYSATLLPNGLIVYIGGRSASSSGVNLTNMAKIQIFDTKSYVWSTKFADGSNIASRVSHSAVLTQDGNIIIYGGAKLNNSVVIGVFSDIAVLNTNSWIWSIPSISGAGAPPLTLHSATLYKNYMIIGFDIQNYTWVTTFNIPTTKNPTKQTQSNGNSSTDQAINNPSNLYIGIGIGMGVVVLAVVLFVIGFFIYKNRHKQEIIETPGTPKNDHIRETHISTVYKPGIPPPANYELTPTYGVPVPGNNHHSS
ncbi:galactose oxidase [Gigaspora margarita]|uniref:Galactose oxidase n=1 Tax=Gigaspora margarita TaxID=4874 RepID=A0A8H4AWA1_GIGMA|nr:galactose oxidase [Gigaspora margarita]